MQKLIATILSGNSADKIRLAIESVINYVDEVLLLDTGITDNTIAVASRVAGDKLHVVKIGWENDFAIARNAAITNAYLRDGSWAITVDTDERLMFPGYDSKEALIKALAASDIELWGVMAADGSYTKERIVRLPTKGHWDGSTHEAFVVNDYEKTRQLEGVRFWEEAKSETEYAHKLNRDLLILQRSIEKDPKNSRWWYYLGQTYMGLELPIQANLAYQEVLKWSNWDEERAWTCYQIARNFANRNMYAEACIQCINGFHEDFRFPELAWMCAWCCYRINNHEEAVVWANMAAAMGNYKGVQAGQKRISFRYLPAWYESPYDVMRHSYGLMGQKTLQEQAEENFNAAWDLRKRTFEIPDS
jgi:tetratricopeptide (TPR) repeat protein